LFVFCFIVDPFALVVIDSGSLLYLWFLDLNSALYPNRFAHS